MKTILFAIFLIAVMAVNTPVVAQNDVSDEGYKLDLELAEIKRERSLIESKFKSSEADCYKKFAVNQCLQERKSEKLLELTDVKRRELAINERKRQLKAEAVDKKAKEKSEKLVNKAQNIEATEVSRTSNHKTAEANKSAKTEKTHIVGNAPGGKPRGTSVPKDQVKLAEQRSAAAQQRVLDSNNKQASWQRKVQSRANKLAQAGENEAKFTQKLQDAQAHKAAVEKANAEKVKAKSAPLPIPALSSVKN